MAPFLAGGSGLDKKQVTRAVSPPSEVWDNDDDFDLSSISGNVLELPRSDIDSDDNGREDDDDDDKGSIRNASGEKNDWDVGFVEDEKEDDEVDTIKVSELAAATLAQLALLRKKPSSGRDDLNLIDSGLLQLKNNLQGKVTNLGSYALKPVAVDMEAGGDWDEDLEVPDTFPNLPLSQNTSSFANDLELETPSIGSTSDTTTSGSMTSDMREKGSKDFFTTQFARQTRSSTSPTSSTFASPSRKILAGKSADDDDEHTKGKPDKEEEDFDLPGQLLTLQLGSSVERMRSNLSIDQQRLLWKEDDKRSISPHYRREVRSSSFSEASAKESEADDGLEGVDLPDQISAKTKAEAPSVASMLQAKLESRKRVAPEASQKDATATGKEVDFSLGLVITEDLDLSINKLKANRFSSRMRDAAHQRRKSRDIRNAGSVNRQADQSATSSLIKSKKDLTSRPILLAPLTSSRKVETGKAADPSSTSRLLASTKASRARETAPRCESPRPSPSFEGTQSSRTTSNTTQEATTNSSSFRRMTSARRDQSQESTTPSLVLPNRGNSTRYSMPTAASRARQADVSRASDSSPLGSPVLTRLMRGPKRPRAYGDGRELEAFDDLPVHQEKETAQLKVKGGETNQQINTVSSNKAAIVERKKTLPLNPTTRPTPASKSLSPATIPSSDATAPHLRSRRSKRKQPTLIRNLGGPNAAPRVECSNMKWNPVQSRWEGNEEEGRNLENALRGTGRPALITRLPIGSPIISSSAKGGLLSPPPPVGARIVGDMIFDPVRLCWLNKNKEDEVDPFAGMDDDFDNDEQQISTTIKGREGIKVKSSSASLRQHSDGSSIVESSSQWSISAINRVLRGSKKEVPNSLASRIPSILWMECIAAKTRHDDEMASFLPNKQSVQTSQIKRKIPIPARDRSSHLYLIQALARKATIG